jgi:hypothetical protein
VPNGIFHDKSPAIPNYSILVSKIHDLYRVPKIPRMRQEVTAASALLRLIAMYTKEKWAIVEIVALAE